MSPISGNWSDASKWLDSTTNTNRVPAPGDTAIIAAAGGAYTVTVDVDVAVAGLTVNSAGATLADSVHNLTVNGAATFSAGAVEVSGAAGFTANGGITNAANVTIDRASAITVAAGQQYVQSAGLTTLNGGNLVSANNGTVQIDGGTLTGYGTIAGSLLNDGTVALNSPGALTITDNYYQGPSLIGVGPSGSLNFTLNGDRPGYDYEVLDIRGGAALGGSLNLTTSGYDPTLAPYSYQPVLYGSLLANPGGHEWVNYSLPAAGETSYFASHSFFVTPATVNTFTVTNTNDSGSGSLRQALSNAGAAVTTTSLSFVIFNIPTTDPGYNAATGTWGISLTSGYVGASQVVIDGTSQPGYNGSPVIEVTGAAAGANALGIAAGPYSWLQGLDVNDFSGTGLWLGIRDKVEGCYIGTDPSGKFAMPNGVGVDINSTAGGLPTTANVVGGVVAEERNVISGNSGPGIRVYYASDDVIQGNYIGTDATGTTALANLSNGVLISYGANEVIGGTILGASNLISGNAGAGIDIDGTVIFPSGAVATYLADGNAHDSAGSFNGTNNGATFVPGVGGQAFSLDGVDDYVESPYKISSNIPTTISAWINVAALPPKVSSIVKIADKRTLLLDSSGAVSFAGTQSSLSDPNAGVYTHASGITTNQWYHVVGTWGGTTSRLYVNGVLHDTQSGGNGNENGLFSDTSIGTGVSGSGVTDFDGLIDEVRIYQRQLSDSEVAQLYAADQGSRSADNLVQGNFIGTDATGEKALPNSWGGIVINHGAEGNTIGGTTPAARNVIAGNNSSAQNPTSGNSAGITLADSGTTGNLIQGNFIGTEATGATSLPNVVGIDIEPGATGNTVGGESLGAGNVISGNKADGMLIKASNDFVQHNLIGAAADGTTALGNGSHGVFVTAGGANNGIGGTGLGDANVIAFNGGDGVLVGSDASQGQTTAAGVGNSILSNSIYANQHIGIDLGPDDGVTPNGSLGYPGVNNKYQPFPVLVSAVSTSGGLEVRGTYADPQQPNTTITLQFFASSGGDPSGYGQGQRFLGTSTITCDGSGDASIAVTLPVSVAPGQYLTATATDPTLNTSEFSAWTQVAPAKITASGLNISATEGAAFNGTLASFTDNDGDPSGNFGAIIMWGDGTSSTGTIGIVSGGGFSVTGSHTYAEEATTLPLTVIVTDTDGTTGTATGTANVADAALHANAASIAATAGATFSGAVATFTDDNPNSTADDYSATIDWGDHTSLTTVSGSQIGEASQTFHVVSSHVYAEAGTYTATITVSDTGGSLRTVKDSVIAAALAPTAVPDTFVLGTGGTVSGSGTTSVLANDTSADGQAQNLVANLVSTTTNGTLTLNADGSFVYTPGANFQGIDRFTYQASEGGTPGNTVTVTLLSYHASLVDKLYHQVLGRGAEDSGLIYWTAQLDAGKSLDVVATGIFNSTERLNPLVTQFYEQYLGRDTDPSGLAYWVADWQVKGDPRDVVENILASPEFLIDAHGTATGFIELLYQRVLQRPYDQVGLDFWLGQISDPPTDQQRLQIASKFYDTHEKHVDLVDFLFSEYFQGLTPLPDPTPYITDLDSGDTETQVEKAIIDSSAYSSNPPEPAAGAVGRALYPY